jgi:hypothetical protein
MITIASGGRGGLSMSTALGEGPPLVVTGARDKSRRHQWRRARPETEAHPAIDGDDFYHGHQLPPVVAPPREQSDSYTPMSVDAFFGICHSSKASTLIGV